MLVFNLASLYGGGICVSISSLVYIGSTVIALNQASGAGGGGIAAISVSSSLFLISTLFQSNMAIESYGGALYVMGGTVTLIDCHLKRNQAKGPYFKLAAGHCSTIGSCIYSTNYPFKYPSKDYCRFNFSDSGSISSISFRTQSNKDLLSVCSRENSVLESFSGWWGFSAVPVRASDFIQWTSDGSVASTGFEICYDLNLRSLGGGLFVDSGDVSLVRTTLCENTATDLGGGIYNSGGQVSVSNGSSIEDNIAGQGSALFLAAGSFSAADISLSGSIAGDSAQCAQCVSLCSKGYYGKCSATLSTSPSCYFNCECFKCPAGKYNPSSGSSSLLTCIDCGSGFAAQAGRSQCAACPKGRFAAADPDDNSGGVTYQTASAATSCNACPAGYYTASVTSIVCQKCPETKYSLSGNTSCELCSSGYFLHGSTCRSCLSGASCTKNGLFLSNIHIMQGFWRISAESELIYSCPMPHSCQGGSNFTEEGDSYCADGYTG